ncbi:MAG: ribonuclease HI family protein [Candidatus Roizmanbacteria bacterium]|nr:MAG: ribonuclease HI family protein [Candidatus Roizmanbacteria bacterium]
MKLKIYTDGGSLNNPGEAAIAYVIYLNDECVLKFSKRIGVATNNFAEYTALIEALTAAKDFIKKYPIKSINVFSDSQLMVSQLCGLYKIKNSSIRDLIMNIRVLEGEINLPIVYAHILREKNQIADSLVKLAFKSKYQISNDK